MRRLAIVLVLIAAACSKKADEPASTPTPTAAPATPSTPEAAREELVKQAVVALGAGDRAALLALYMSDDELRSMAECTSDPRTIRDGNLDAVLKSIPPTTFTFVKWLEKPPLTLPKGKQAAGCTANMELVIVNGEAMFSSKDQGALVRGMSIIKTAAGWKLSQIADH